MVQRIILTAKSLEEIEGILNETGFDTSRTRLTEEEKQKLEEALRSFGLDPEQHHNYDEITAFAGHVEVRARYLSPALEPQLAARAGEKRVKIHYCDIHNTSEGESQEFCAQAKKLYDALLERLPRATVFGPVNLTPIER